MIDDSVPQPLSDSKYCESECSKDSNHRELECAKDPCYSRYNTSEVTQDLFQIWKARSLCPPLSLSTSTVHPNSRNDCTTKLQWKLYPNSSSAKLCSRKSESSGYGGSLKHLNHGAWYTSHQSCSVLTIPYYLFFSAP
jgi:hypothetical protein